MNPSITIDRKILLAMRRLSGDDESRDALFGTLHFDVQAKSGQTIVVASDGRRLAAYLAGNASGPPDTDYAATIRISAEMIGALPTVKGHQRVTLSFERDAMKIEGEHNVGIVCPKLAADFPKWRVVIPSCEQAPARNIAVNSEYFSSMISLAQCANELNDQLCAMRLWQNAHTDPIVCEFTLFPELIAVLMGVRLSDDQENQKTITAPKWATTP